MQDTNRCCPRDCCLFLGGVFPHSSPFLSANPCGGHRLPFLFFPQRRGPFSRPLSSQLITISTSVSYICSYICPASFSLARSPTNPSTIYKRCALTTYLFTQLRASLVVSLAQADMFLQSSPFSSSSLALWLPNTLVSRAHKGLLTHITPRLAHLLPMCCPCPFPPLPHHRHYFPFPLPPPASATSASIGAAAVVSSFSMSPASSCFFSARRLSYCVCAMGWTGGRQVSPSLSVTPHHRSGNKQAIWAFIRPPICHTYLEELLDVQPYPQTLQPNTGVRPSICLKYVPGRTA